MFLFKNIPQRKTRRLSLASEEAADLTPAIGFCVLIRQLPSPLWLQQILTAVWGGDAAARSLGYCGCKLHEEAEKMSRLCDCSVDLPLVAKSEVG